MSKRRTLAADKNSFQTYCHSSDIIIFMKFDNQLISIHSIQLGLKQIVFHLNNDVTQFDYLPKLAPKVEIFFKWRKIWMFVLQFCKPTFPIEEHFCLQLLELSGVLATLPVRLLWNAAIWETCIGNNSWSINTLFKMKYCSPITGLVFKAKPFRKMVMFP